MVWSEPRGSEASGPYFFLSYAHTPGDGDDDSDPDLWVHRLFRDLSGHIRHMTTVSGSDAGFMDRNLRTGQNWPDEIAQSLTGCRVFVPLYSPRYFISPWCGREWTVFGRRHAEFVDKGEAGTPSAVVPAIWSPVPDRQLPETVRDMQYTHPDLGNRYRTFGLYGLIKVNSFRADYQRAVLQLARRIVEVGESIAVEPGDGTHLESAHDAFASPRAVRSTASRTLRISVAAGSQDRLPEGRSPDCYGSSPLAWNPYHPESDQPLVRTAEAVAGRLDYRPVVQEFDHDSEPADGPEILLLDRWVLRDPGHRERLKVFDADSTRPTGLVVPWNEADPDSHGVQHELAAEVESAMPLRTSRQRLAGRSAALGIPDHRTFNQLLPEVVTWASKEYLRTAAAHPPSGTGTERFRVGDSGSHAGRPPQHRRNAEEGNRDEQP
ncbi:FxsC-like protein [Streptomyces sp. Ag109_O5-1]|uniref:TIR-like protein FxsC n=1 Tax=Streptomyces sp. Ag109_O5-1 TaxID=1938851 RepID=UPI000F4DFF27|nr:TIR-like protein FxsC [Streptomyces sp. Ag109_O5-1]RPE38405.1 FxsC-like protein [Streptomyces sp. Ag109_O5-1]